MFYTKFLWSFLNLAVVTVTPLVYSTKGGGVQFNKQLDRVIDQTATLVSAIKGRVSQRLNNHSLDALNKWVDSFQFETGGYSKFLNKLYRWLKESDFAESIEVLSPYGHFPIKGYEPTFFLSKAPDNSFLISARGNDFESRRLKQQLFAYFFSPNWETASNWLGEPTLKNFSFFVRNSFSDELEPRGELLFLRSYKGGRHYLKLVLNPTWENKDNFLIVS